VNTLYVGVDELFFIGGFLQSFSLLQDTNCKSAKELGKWLGLRLVKLLPTYYLLLGISLGFARGIG